MHDIHPDGDRFIFVTYGEGEEVPTPGAPGDIGPVAGVVNWFGEFQQLMGG